MSWTLSEIAAALGGRVQGDGALPVSGAAAPEVATKDQLAIALSPRLGALIGDGAARAALVWPGADLSALGLEAAIELAPTRLSLGAVTAAFKRLPDFAPGVHPSAVIDHSAQIGEGASIGPLAVIGPDVVIGAGARIGPHVTLGAGSVLGQDALIHAGVRIGAGTRIGDNFVAQAGTVIGSDGFSFATQGPSNPERAKATGGAENLTAPEDGTWHKVQSLGGVVIGDDVELGANTCIDGGTLKPTTIGRGTKVDNLVHIAHNCEVGEDVLLCGQVGLAGSVVIGDRVVLGGQCGVGDHHTIGADVVAGAASKILTNVPAGRVVLGYPAYRMDQAIKGHKTLRRLSRGDR